MATSSMPGTSQSAVTYTVWRMEASSHAAMQVMCQGGLGGIPEDGGIDGRGLLVACTRARHSKPGQRWDADLPLNGPFARDRRGHMCQSLRGQVRGCYGGGYGPAIICHRAKPSHPAVHTFAKKVARMSGTVRLLAPDVSITMTTTLSSMRLVPASTALAPTTAYVCIEIASSGQHDCSV